MSIRPLPRRPAPFHDELLSSWIARLARANHCSVSEFCGYLELVGKRAPEVPKELSGADINRLCPITRLARDDVNGMLLKRKAEFPVESVAWSNFQYCPTCVHQTPEVSLRHWRYAWSMVCEICGSELLPMRADRDAGNPIFPRLRTRAIKGARQLKLAYRQGNSHAGRRVDLTRQVTGVLAPELRNGALFSQSRHDRFDILAAINLGMTRPLLALALALGEYPSDETRLRLAFPHKRKLLDRLASLAGDLPSFGTGGGEKRTDRSRRQRTATVITPQPEYLAAARQAIKQLGETADSGDLLRCAEAILKTTRQHPVDVQ